MSEEINKTVEVNFDGLVGPTHFYGGLSVGNVASIHNRGESSRPKEAFLQGLQKMRRLIELGLYQSFLPPLFRPCYWKLQQWGLQTKSKPHEALKELCEQSPSLFQAVCSASSMWTANAATVSPSYDTTDGRVHFSTANLSSKLHRSIEAFETFFQLQQIFSDSSLFKVHPPLADGEHFGDEGAANHTRFCPSYGARGLHLFVYGKDLEAISLGPRKFPARQSKQAFEVIARQHGLAPEQCVFARQNPEVIDQGVFHNDVISVGNKEFFFCHEKAFEDPDALWGELQESYQILHPGRELERVLVTSKQVPVEQAVKSYLFNTQLCERPDGSRIMIAPTECRENQDTARLLRELKEQRIFSEVFFLDVRQSMKNGGGPACLRLRVVLDERQWNALPPFFRLDQMKLDALEEWGKTYYPDEFHPQDLLNPKSLDLLERARRALADLVGLPQLARPIQGELNLHE